MDVTRCCILTGGVNTRFIEGLTQDMLDAWSAGALAQDAFAGISADWREFIMTGILPEVWDSEVKAHATAWTWDDELEGEWDDTPWEDPSDGVDLCPVDGRPLPPLDYKGRQIV